jgi:hypothetical protein
MLISRVSTREIIAPFLRPFLRQGKQGRQDDVSCFGGPANQCARRYKGSGALCSSR